MAPSIIRMNGDGHWGTAFAVNDGSSVLRFHTAAHVLKDVGLPANATHASVLMCDGPGSPLLYDIDNIARDIDCDLATFTSTFPARPFILAATLPTVGASMNVTGYLWLRPPQGRMPDCGVSSTLFGPLSRVGNAPTCNRNRLLIDLHTVEAHLYGMSGGPVTVVGEDSEVIAVFGGANHIIGGPPFIATSIL